MVGARELDPAIPTCRIVVPGWIIAALAGGGVRVSPRLQASESVVILAAGDRSS
jgi:hypothetical protein